MNFKKGDWVRVAKDLGPSMRHFTANVEAIVVGSYADQYGGSDRDRYTLYLKGKGECSWYDGQQLTLVEAGRLDKLQAWVDEDEAERKQKSDLDWVFANSERVLKEPHGASVQALASCFGLTNLWGRHGEGITFYANVMGTLHLAKPFLVAGDKVGWLALCQSIKTDACISHKEGGTDDSEGTDEAGSAGK